MTKQIHRYPFSYLMWKVRAIDKDVQDYINLFSGTFFGSLYREPKDKRWPEVEKTLAVLEDLRTQAGSLMYDLALEANAEFSKGEIASLKKQLQEAEAEFSIERKAKIGQKKRKKQRRLLTKKKARRESSSKGKGSHRRKTNGIDE